MIQQISAEIKNAPHFNKLLDLNTSKFVSNLFSHNVSPKVYTAIQFQGSTCIVEMI